MNRVRLQICGESGSGLLSTGEILVSALNDMGYNIVADREYPSLIKGGHSLFSINFSTEPIKSLSEKADILLALDKQSLEAYVSRLKSKGNLIHGYEKIEGLKAILADTDFKVTNVKGREIAKKQGGFYLMVNTILIGVTWKVLGFKYEIIEAKVKERFGKKVELLETNLKCLRAGYDSVESNMKLDVPKRSASKKMIIDGNKAIALGAVHAGLRAYYAYPMSPSSSILTQVSLMAKSFGIVVKQAEDEITAAQMALGSMYAGTRSMTATSGGGFDLMTETVSLAGITEVPLVIVLAQRPGPGTGLPTWTAQADLNLAIYSGHGEFAKLVIAVSDPEDCFDLIQEAFNYAEVYQIPVIVLTEKVIAESHYNLEKFKQNKIKIERGLVTGKELKNLKNSDRYKISQNGISQRWVPTRSEAYYFCNGDEHWQSGELSEESTENKLMYAKRNLKLTTLEKELPEPEIFGVQEKADISFVGWGSSKNVMLDIISEYKLKGININYLHYSYIYPLKTERLMQFFDSNKNVHLIEGNYQGQLGQLITSKTCFKFVNSLLKYDGRPFFIEDIHEYLNNNLN